MVPPLQMICGLLFKNASSSPAEAEVCSPMEKALPSQLRLWDDAAPVGGKRSE